jgi:hypothetical protein
VWRRPVVDVTAFIVRIPSGVEVVAGVVEFPGSERATFRSGDELIEVMQAWLDDAVTPHAAALADETQFAGRDERYR